MDLILFWKEREGFVQEIRSEVITSQPSKQETLLPVYFQHHGHAAAHLVQSVQVQGSCFHLKSLEVEAFECLRGFPHGEGADILHPGDAHGHVFVEGRQIHLRLRAHLQARQEVLAYVESKPYIVRTLLCV